MEQPVFWQRAWEMGVVTGKSAAIGEYAKHINEALDETNLKDSPEVQELINKIVDNMYIDNHSLKLQAETLGKTMLEEEYSDGISLDKERLRILLNDNK